MIFQDYTLSTLQLQQYLNTYFVMNRYGHRVDNRRSQKRCSFSSLDDSQHMTVQAYLTPQYHASLVLLTCTLTLDDYYSTCLYLIKLFWFPTVLR